MNIQGMLPRNIKQRIVVHVVRAARAKPLPAVSFQILMCGKSL